MQQGNYNFLGCSEKSILKQKYALEVLTNENHFPKTEPIEVFAHKITEKNVAHDILMCSFKFKRGILPPWTK